MPPNAKDRFEFGDNVSVSNVISHILRRHEEDIECSGIQCRGHDQGASWTHKLRIFILELVSSWNVFQTQEITVVSIDTKSTLIAY